MVPIDSLPSELLSEIFSYLPPESHHHLDPHYPLYTSSLVCRGWRDVAQRALFQNVVLGGPRQGDAWLRSSARSRYRTTSLDMTGWGETLLPYAIFEACPGLASLRVEDSMDGGYEWCASHWAHGLQSLELCSPARFPQRFGGGIDMLSARNLRHLRIHHITDLGIHFIEAILLPSRLSLVSLSLFNLDINTATILGTIFATTPFPLVRHLALEAEEGLGESWSDLISNFSSLASLASLTITDYNDDVFVPPRFFEQVAASASPTLHTLMLKGSTLSLASTTELIRIIQLPNLAGLRQVTVPLELHDAHKHKLNIALLDECKRRCISLSFEVVMASSLAPELLCDILERVSRADLRQAALVCRHWREPAQRTLFTTVVLRLPPQADAWLECPARLRYRVRRLEMFNLRRAVQLPMLLLNACPNLTSLTLESLADGGRECCESPLVEGLHSLSMWDSVSFPTTGRHPLTIRNLRHLFIFIKNTNPHVLKTIFLHFQETLVSLSIDGLEIASATSLLELLATTARLEWFRNLRQLTMSRSPRDNDDVQPVLDVIPRIISSFSTIDTLTVSRTDGLVPWITAVGAGAHPAIQNLRFYDPEMFDNDAAINEIARIITLPNCKGLSRIELASVPKDRFASDAGLALLDECETRTRNMMDEASSSGL